MNKDRYTQQRVIDAIQAARGIKAAAARALGCSRQTVTNYIDRYPAVKEAYQEARDTLLDDAESALVALVEKQEWPAVRFLLVTLGKDRGFVERSEIQQLGGDLEARHQQFEAEARRIHGD